jgi:hypothetical protein
MGTAGAHEPCLSHARTEREARARARRHSCPSQGMRSPGLLEATRLSQIENADKKFSGTSSVASRNRLIHIYVTYGTIRSNFAPCWGHSSSRQAPSGEKPDALATANFRELLFHALW